MNFQNIVIGIYFIIVVYFGVRGVSAFNQYCEDFAKSSNMLNEFYKSNGTDENSLNKFQRYVYKKIMTGDFSEDDVSVFAGRGRELATQLRRLKYLSIAFILLIAYFYRQLIFFSD